MGSLSQHRYAGRGARSCWVIWTLGAISVTLLTNVATASDIGHEIVDQVREESLRDYLYSDLYTRAGHDKGYLGSEHDLARDRIAALFGSYGLEVELQEFVDGDVTGVNVIATQRGTTFPDTHYILGAHYDTVHVPGADDDASGVAGLLEIARLLSVYETDYTIKYIAFDHEEIGLLGSIAYVLEHLDDDIRGMVQLDMLAWNKGRARVRFTGTELSDPLKFLLVDAFAEYAPGIDTLVEYGFGGSNHAPFEYFGFQACLVIEKSHDQNPYYHDPRDTVDTPGYLDYWYWTDLVRGVAGFITDQAGVHYPNDCDEDGTPDTDQITADPGVDCNGNQILDVCEYGADVDCNENGIPDFCDIAAGTSPDGDQNGIPDECQPVRRVPSEYATIQAAVDAAEDGDIIEVADGVYTNPVATDITVSEKALYIRSANGSDTCTLDGEGVHGFLRIPADSARTVTIEGFQLVNGGSVTEGGAVYCEQSMPVFRDCVFTNCGHVDAPTGGALHCFSASPRFFDCAFEGCSAMSGGAVYAEVGSMPRFVDCRFIDNYASDRGGAVACLNPDGVTHNRPSFLRCRFESNWADWGGAFYGEDHDTLIEACVFDDNTAAAIDGGGGAIATTGMRGPTISDCEFRENTSVGRGGALLAIDDDEYGVRVALRRSLFDGNQAAEGGALALSMVKAQIEHCVIRENSADTGGAILFEGERENVFLRNCMLVENRAGASGGAIACVEQALPAIGSCLLVDNTAPVGGGLAANSGSTPVVSNSIVWGNSAELGAQFAVLAECVLNVDHCDVAGGADGVHLDAGANLVWGDGNLDADPAFAFGGADYHLLAESPCIDAGSAEPPAGLTIDDLDGYTRLDDGDGDGTIVVDLGPCEFAGAASCIAVQQTDFEFFVALGGPNPPDQYLRLRDCGGATLEWVVTPDCDWLEVIPTAGASDGEIDEVVLRVDATGLQHGDHVGTLTIDDPLAVNRPRTANVLLHVNTTLNVPLEYERIQDAIDATVAGDTIIVADGVYTGERNRGLEFGGRALTLRSENGPEACIIDCEFADRGLNFHAGEGPGAILSGFTITNGYGSFGAGIYCNDSSPTIVNCIIRDCTTPTDPYGNRRGGGVFLSASDAALINCVIADNTAIGHAGGTIGGGVYCHGGSAHPRLINCTLFGNTSTARGGAIGASYCGDLGIFNCVVFGNAAPDGPELSLEGAMTVVSVNRSDMFGGSDIVYSADGATLVWGPGNIDADPLFVDSNSDDFHLLAGSPCIDAGGNAFIPPDVADLDFDGDLDEITPLDLDYEGRFFDDPDTFDTGCGSTPYVDMGAYEFGGTGPAPCVGDLDGDRFVGLADLAELLAGYSHGDDRGDLDCDGDTDLNDLADLLANYQTACP